MATAAVSIDRELEVSFQRQFDSLRATFDSGRTRPYEWRAAQLTALGKMVAEREADILAALKKDLGKPELEAFATEVGYVASEVTRALKQLGKWMKPESVSTPAVAQPGKSRIIKEPLGVVLIIGPWNYPFQLVMNPLLGALAAGNCAVLKPSEVAPATSQLIADLVPRYLDADAVKVVQGAVPETTALLTLPFDHIFYTGNGTVGRIVMAAAANHLTPTTLELGGKSPTVVDADVDLDVVAKRIVWGKFTNAGQTCVAPDYVLADQSIYEPLVVKLRDTILDFYGVDPQLSPDYGRIINTRHYQRLMGLMSGGQVVCGGEGDESDRYIAPTVLREVDESAAVMQDEIFGPILPVMRVSGVDAAIRFINRRPKPLALYLFSDRKAVQERVVEETSAGGMTINHAWMHLAVPELPFGGVGESGMGAYHGKASFDTFTHRKSVLSKGTLLDPPIAYPPYTEAKKKWLRRLV